MIYRNIILNNYKITSLEITDTNKPLKRSFSSFIKNRQQNGCVFNELLTILNQITYINIFDENSSINVAQVVTISL